MVRVACGHGAAPHRLSRARGPAHRGPRPAARRHRPTDLLEVVDRPDAAADRPDRGDRAQRGPRRLEPPRLVVPARAPEAGARAGPDALRAQRARAADGRPRPLPRRRAPSWPSYERVARLAPRQRPLPARHPRPAGRLRAADLARHPGHVRGAVGLDRVDEQPQRHPDARVPDDARRGRDRRPRRARAAVGPGRAGVSGRRRRPVGRGGRADQERAAARARSASPGGRRRRCRSSRSTSARPASRPSSRASRASGASTRPRSAADFEGRTALLSPFDRLVHDRARAAGAVRLRVHPRDVQAGGQAPLGLLRAADPPRRPAGREGRRHRRPQGRPCCG